MSKWQFMEKYPQLYLAMKLGRLNGRAFLNNAFAKYFMVILINAAKLNGSDAN